ncbi:UNVERIFIED_CONTAM: hypothetical protein FKN15_031783 [Acipenser sinensis]
MDRHSRLCLLPEVVFRTGPWLFTAEAIISSRAAALGVCCHRPRSPSQGTIWRQCTTDIWVLTTIQTGYSLQFKHDPSPFQGVTPTSVMDLKNDTVVPQEPHPNTEMFLSQRSFPALVVMVIALTAFAKSQEVEKGYNRKRIIKKNRTVSAAKS